MTSRGTGRGPRCGNNPNYRMSAGDRAVVKEFRAYLAARKGEGPPLAGGSPQELSRPRDEAESTVSEEQP
jgi:hypothetical protein